MVAKIDFMRYLPLLPSSSSTSFFLLYPVLPSPVLPSPVHPSSSSTSSFFLLHLVLPSFPPSSFSSFFLLNLVLPFLPLPSSPSFLLSFPPFPPPQELVRHEDRIALSSSEAIGPSLGVRLPEEDDDIIFMGTTEELGVGGGGGGFRSLAGLGQFMRGPWGQGRGRRPPPPVSHVFNTAPMRSLLLQMTESPQIMQNMFSAPYIQVMVCELLFLDATTHL